MNRRNLTAAVLAGLAGAAGIVGSAQAVNINPDGLGQVLIYPYYTVNGGNQTVLSVVNTTEEGKAVKVRFLEGENSQEVLDFNLYMSQWDVWTAVIYDDAGTPTMATGDNTCTVPYIYSYNNRPFGAVGGQQEFLNYELDDGGQTGIERAREGHFEMIEMGTLDDFSRGSEFAATHIDGLQPNTWIQSISQAFNPPLAPRPCGQLIDAWTDPDNTVPGDEGYWLMNPLTDLTNPTGGLFGGAAVINVQYGAMYSYDATAINGFAATLIDTGFVPLHQQPGFILPGLNSGDTLTATVFNSDGSTSSATLARGVDAVSYVFMHDQLMNEYTTEMVVGAQTEWIVTFPTKQFYVFEEQSGSNTGVPPFTSFWDATLTDFSAEACEVVQLDTIWDRDERKPGFVPGQPVPPVVSPAPDNPDPDGKPAFELCYETSVIRFGDVDTVGATTEILGSSNFHNIDNEILGFEFGWARLQLADWPEVDAEGEIVPGGQIFTRSLPVVGGVPLEGLPVAGFAVQRFANNFVGAAAGLIASYGGIYDHKYTRRIGSGCTSGCQTQ